MSDYITKIITEADGNASTIDADGWGDDSKQTNVHGKPMNIQICRNGKAQFSIRICDDGQLILTDYASMNYKMHVPQNLALRPSCPWEDWYTADKKLKMEQKGGEK